jgi:hypothetical protein
MTAVMYMNNPEVLTINSSTLFKNMKKRVAMQQFGQLKIPGKKKPLISGSIPGREESSPMLSPGPNY